MDLIQCSMGRDSLALVEYLKDKLDDCLVLFVDAGGALPEVDEIAKKVEKRVKHFYRLQTNSNEWINANGIPADIVPVWHTVKGIALSGNEFPAIASSFDCCWNNIMNPMHEFAKEIGAKKIYRGQRNAERLKSPIRSGYVDGDIEIVFPLENWSDDDVNEYLESKGVELPEWYEHGDKGFDCWWCTGFVAESRGLHKYLESHHPGKWAIVKERLDAVRGIVEKEIRNGAI